MRLHTFARPLAHQQNWNINGEKANQHTRAVKKGNLISFAFIFACECVCGSFNAKRWTPCSFLRFISISLAVAVHMFVAEKFFFLISTSEIRCTANFTIYNDTYARTYNNEHSIFYVQCTLYIHTEHTHTGLTLSRKPIQTNLPSTQHHIGCALFMAGKQPA